MKILVVATTRLCSDGLTAVLIRCAETAASVHSVSFALGESPEPGIPERLRKTGAVHLLPSRRKQLPAYMHSLARVIREGKYDAVHIHGNSATMAFDLIAAARGGAKKRITHCHNCGPQPLLKQKTLGTVLNRLVTRAAACSAASGEMLYRKDFQVITNGVDCERFRFNEEARNQVRKELNLEDCLVIGHMGRFFAQKNQERLIRIFAYLAERNPKARLLLIGDGKDREACIQKVNELGLSEQVVFISHTDQPEDYYSAMDVLVMPSLFEGLPLVGVEAQANGLHCVFSDQITRETDLTGKNRFIPLERDDAVWAETILGLPQESPEERKKAADIVRAKGYDQEKLKEQVLKLYE